MGERERVTLHFAFVSFKSLLLFSKKPKLVTYF